MDAARYPAWLRRAIYAEAVERNLRPAGGVYRRTAIVPASIYEAFGVQFAWDAPYSALAASAMGAHELAAGFIENMLDQAVTEGPDRGMVPRSVTWEGTQAGQYGSQPPLLGWAARSLHRRRSDDAFLERIYPGLAACIDWWQSARRDGDGDGLSEYAGPTAADCAYESGHDYSPERDDVLGDPPLPDADGLVRERFADVFLNSCIHEELDVLAELARRCDPEREQEWVERREALAARMRELMWDAAVGGFFPVLRSDVSASRERIYHHTPALIMPLWAGIATVEQAAATVRLLRGEAKDYPSHEGVMSIRLGDDLHRGYQVVTDGLHPTRGAAAAAAGVQLGTGVARAVFGTGRLVAETVFSRIEVNVSARSLPPSTQGQIRVTVRDGSGRLHQVCTGPVEPGDAVTRISGEIGRPLRFRVDSQSALTGEADWITGLTEIEVTWLGCSVNAIEVAYIRPERRGLMSPFGIRSAHPLDGKHPARGAPTQFWSGSVWGPHQIHAFHALARYGYDDLARASALAFCDAVVRAYAAGGDVGEHLSADDGCPLGAPGYVWTGGLALALMAELDEASDGD